MIRINCFFQAHDQLAYDYALAAAKLLVKASQSHEGVVAYDVFESGTRPLIFMICETWRDQAALDKHSATAEFGKYVGVMQECGDIKTEIFEF